MAENKSKALVAGIFTLIGVILGAGLNYYLTLDSERQKALRDTRRKAYVDFLHSHVIWDSAQSATSEKDKQEITKEYYKKTAEARKRIAVYGNKAVVEALANYWRIYFQRRDCSGSHDRVKDDVAIYHSMREDIMPGSEQVSDADMMMLVFLCKTPEKQTWIKNIFSGTK